ncbi:MAG: hypothetical protein U5L11_08620 [Arhodomonas sp.]|nr:hypothetical protein [Arhodomonas sp.]
MVFEWLLEFAFLFPLIMAWVWISGGLWYFFHRECGTGYRPEDPAPAAETPPCSIIIPCYNEEANLRTPLLTPTPAATPTSRLSP